MKKLSILFALSTFTLQAMAAVPNTFVAGTPAKAAEVNQNFTYLDTKINDIEDAACANDTSTSPGTYTYTANNTAAGTVLNLNAGGVSTSFTILSFPIYDQSTGKRYAVKIPYNSNIDILIRNVVTGCFGNMTIAGYPAMINAWENQSIDRNVDSSTVFTKAFVTGYIQIKVGTTLLQVTLNFNTSTVTNGTDGGTPFDLTDDITSGAQSSRLTAAILEVDNYIDRIVITEI